MKTKLLIIIFLSSLNSFSQVIYSEQFDQGINNFQSTTSLTTSLNNDNLTINGNGTSGAWDNIRYDFHNSGTNTTINASSSPKIYLKIKAENSPVIRVDFVDSNGYSTTQYGLTASPTSEFQIYELNYTDKLIDGGYGGPCTSGPCNVDATQLVQLAFYINPGSGNYSGEIEIEWISIGESFEIEPPLQLDNAKVVGYLPDYRFGVSNQIEYDKVTHLMLCFANPDASGNLVMSDFTQVVQDATTLNPDIKIFISLAGALDHNSPTAGYWSDILITPSQRTNFITQVVNFVNTHNLDGVDVDLEFDLVTAGYSDFILELDAALDLHNKQISAAFPKVFYDNLTQTALEAFDFVNLMAYDASGFWDTNPGQHSSYNFAEENINFWKTTGNLDGEKLVLGVPFYGHNYDSEQYVTYGEMIGLNTNNADLDNVGNTYYNGRPTIEDKVELAYNTVGGIMIWELGQDSFTEYSLLNTIHEKYTDLGVTTTGLGSNASTLSINDFIELDNSLIVYPNPTSDYVNIKTNFNIESVMIYDNIGKLIYSGDSKILDISNFDNGLYFLKIKTIDNNASTKKILKK
jgi:chitinase|tara:strand:- start:9752 stop:11479 length:1728 start_codon:yes stop_codon:yes gene_type:complete